MTATVYSSTPLAKKLGLKDGFVIRLHNEPNSYRSVFADWPLNVLIENKKEVKKNFIHFFAGQAKDLQQLPALKSEIVPDGIIWISWPKKASKIPTDITEDIIRQTALAVGLVDIKVCAVNEVWSALKLVIPVKDRDRLTRK